MLAHMPCPATDDAMTIDDTLPPLAWDERGHPYSPRFGDRYRSEGLDGRGGLAQARHVFLAGVGLCTPEGTPVPGSAWAFQPAWHILENGFGLGLNFLATWQLWQRDPCRPVTLAYHATEAFPPTSADVWRAASSFPELQAQARVLADGWDALLGRGRLALEGGAVRLHLHVGDAEKTLLQRLSESDAVLGFDSVFLDGFDPRRNPAMWSETLMRAIGRLARPGTRAATWCVARTVRDTLAAAGFEVQRRPGLPPKRHCLVAHWPGLADRATL
jgi:tRNA 5-methylaminomethyl-2-thiouridine biosynthesis bifunctional protein